MGETDTWFIPVVPELGETKWVLSAVEAVVWIPWDLVSAATAAFAGVAVRVPRRTYWSPSFDVRTWTDDDAPCKVPGWEFCADCSGCV